MTTSEDDGKKDPFDTSYNLSNAKAGSIVEMSSAEVWEGANGTFAKNDGVWEQIDNNETPMGWPQAVSSVVVAISVTVILVVLLLVTWGPW